MFSQFAGIAGMAGINLSSGGGNLQDLTKIIQSDAVAVKVIEDLKLKEKINEWKEKDLTEQEMVMALSKLFKDPKIDGNIMELKVENTDPVLAAEIANDFVDSLSYYWNKLNYSEAKKKKEYIESQLPRVESDLKGAEERLKRFTLLSNRGSGSSVASGLLGIASASQSQGIEVARLNREYDIQNSVYTMLRQEYEQVRLEESKEFPPFSIVDKAVKPEKKSTPKVKLNTMIGLIIGLLSGIFVAYFGE